MILGVDHISVSGVDWQADTEVLERLGFVRRFAQLGLANAVQKTPLLRLDRCDRHDIVVFDGCNSPSLELTVHGSSRPRAGHLGYVPLIQLRPEVTGALPIVPRPSKDLGAVLEEVFGEAITCRTIIELEAEMWVMTGGETALVAATHLVRDLDGSAAFLEHGLRFRPLAAGQTEGRQWRTFAMASPLAKWHLKLLLYSAANGEYKPLMLDDAGFPCLALLSSAVTTDVAALTAWACETIEVFSTEVAGKPLQIGMLRGPSGELIELIEIKR